VIDSAHLSGMLLASGALLAKFFASPLGGPFGVIVPVASGLLAVSDLYSRKVIFTRTPDSPDAAQDVKRERLRKRAVRLWIAQVAVAVISGALILWLYVIDDIPKKGDPPIATPTLFQSALLIALLILTLAAIAIGFARIKTAAASTG
jgi:hypothetical protein